jgi:methylenetetrahydrofolate dehydrogenase (NADP+)/methenyltetrahydrofolate cyclohydrolase
MYDDLCREIAELKAKGVTPGLAVILIGDNPASRAYVRSKDKMCRELGLHSVKLELSASTTQTELLGRVKELNRDPGIHGILVQSPPPEHIDEAAIVRALDPRKDVDGFHPENVAKLVLDDPSGFVPCTPLGVQRLLTETKVEIDGAHVVVLGRSMIVGKPLALLLMQKNKTETLQSRLCIRAVAISRDYSLADIVAAIGARNLSKLITCATAVVIDVGINQWKTRDERTPLSPGRRCRI